MSAFKNILCIINPASGSRKVILRDINQSFAQYGVEWDVLTTSKKIPLQDKINAFDLTKYDLICVYGGDGTHHEAAKVLDDSSKPLLFLHGGTANFLSHELGIPENTSQALTHLFDEKYTLKKIDSMIVNDALVLNSVVIGPLTSINTSSTREMKDSLGFMAYAYTFFSQLPQLTTASHADYTLQIDQQEKQKVKGSGVIILNGKLHSFLKMKMSNLAAVDNGLLTVIVTPELTTNSVSNAFLTAIKTGSFDEMNQVFQCRHVRVETEQKKTVLFDEQPWQGTELTAEVNPESILTFVLKKAVK